MLKTVGNPSVRYGDQTVIDGNVVIGTANKGIDFSANSHPAGMTSELFNDYEEGTWSPILGGSVSGSWTATATYTKIGRLVFFNIVQTAGTISASAAVELFSGLPYTPARPSVATFTNSSPSINGTAMVETNARVYCVEAITSQTALRFTGMYEV